MKTTEDTKRFVQALSLLAKTRTLLSHDLALRAKEIEHGDTRGLPWPLLMRELMVGPCS